MSGSRTLLLLPALLAIACVPDPGPPSSRSRGAPLVDDVAPVRDPQPSARVTHPAIAALAPESRDAIDRAAVPLFVLPEQYASGTLVMAEEHWSALTYRDETITISLHATNLWHDALDEEELAEMPTPSSTVRGQPAWETVNELIRSVAWNERGIAYALEVECARPEDDTRCTESEFLHELTGQLIPAGGEGAR